jgi:hypothetical protein
MKDQLYLIIYNNKDEPKVELIHCLSNKKLKTSVKTSLKKLFEIIPSEVMFT